MRVDIEEKMVVATMSAREAGKIAESLAGLSMVPKDLQDFKALFDGMDVPDPRRGELRHEWGDPLDMDPDIGPA